MLAISLCCISILQKTDIFQAKIYFFFGHMKRSYTEKVICPHIHELVSKIVQSPHTVPPLIFSSRKTEE